DRILDVSQVRIIPMMFVAPSLASRSALSRGTTPAAAAMATIAKMSSRHVTDAILRACLTAFATMVSYRNS
ncbi:unnamed protein product, partial [Ectocarpus sp. 8 AP-2014]